MTTTRFYYAVLRNGAVWKCYDQIDSAEALKSAIDWATNIANGKTHEEYHFGPRPVVVRVERMTWPPSPYQSPEFIEAEWIGGVLQSRPVTP